MDPASQAGLEARVSKGLGPLMSVFGDKDKLLAKQAYPQLYYLFLKVLTREYAHPALYGRAHTFLEWFHVERITNLAKPEDDRDPVLVEFGRLMQQGTNDRESLRTRVGTLRRYFLQQNADIAFRDPKRAFSDEERLAIWILAGKQCQECSRDLPDVTDMEADHQLQWAFGGATEISNSRALCGPCNLALAKKVK